ncbi:hypothetical protein KHA96_08250 [Bacillus sp. FJAT-49711]|uniref:hypothetical protein n=1 Tax=Bacillus sp. FJAT-49711 TaxID=2833585 RepID=UPI001BC8F478|nr:hypothetical protein [Bacillus sp. FJAT-49711]MBS4218300.1 hypothetical protein [Bacillus sp. FJAT-49711]
MIGLIIAIVLFNVIALATNKRLTKNQIIHIWTFTIVFQVIVDHVIDLQFHGYWYFTEIPEWRDLLPITVLIPPVNIIFVNWYPFGKQLYKRIFYVAVWFIFITCYELVTLLPEPWGYFHHAWWNIWYSAIVNPFLLMSVILYYKWICKIENSLVK